MAAPATPEAEKKFRAAAAFVREDPATGKLAQETKLRLYGLYKAATAGPCTEAQPSIFDQVGRSKHAAWVAQGDKAEAKAVAEYVALVEEVCPDFADAAGLPGAREEAEPVAGEDDTSSSPSLKKQPSVDALMEQVATLRRQLAARPTMPEEPAEAAGYLYQYQAKYSFRLGKWVLRYFALDGDTLRVYKSPEHRQKRSPLDSWRLRSCVVRYEGSKKRGRFHVFSVYLADSEHIISHGGELILRASATTAKDAALWLNALQDAITAADAKDQAELEVAGAPGTLGLASLEVPDDGESAPPPDEELTLRRQLSEAVARNAQASGSRLMSVLRGAPAEASALPARKAFDPSSYPPSRPMHKGSQVSLMSAAAGDQDYRGFLNLAGLLLVVVNFRMIIDNIKRYGLLFRVPSFSDRFEDWPCLSGIVLLNVHVLLALQVERFAARGLLPASVAAVLHVLNINGVLVIPCVLIFSPVVSSPPAASVYLFTATVLWLKLVSYAHVNQDWRRATGDALAYRTSLDAAVKDQEAQVTYPDNLTLGDVYYFWCAPTLSYQLNYPRSERVRKGYVFTLLMRLCAVAGLIVFISEQYILPGIEASMEAFDRGEPFRIAERVITLSVPTTYVWLLGFYLLFHLGFNLLAELLRFGDRVFYKDWWNASNIEAYWRLWNLPVHHWMVRHCYFPCLRFGLSKNAAIFCVFFVSAFFHELLVSVPFKTVRTYAFFAMMAQIPLVALSKQVDRFFGRGQKHVGNFLFWTSFCIVGQPFTVLLYYYDLSRTFGAEQGVMDAGPRDASSGGEGMAFAVRHALNATMKLVLGARGEMVHG